MSDTMFLFKSGLFLGAYALFNFTLFLFNALNLAFQESSIVFIVSGIVHVGALFLCAIWVDESIEIIKTNKHISNLN